MAHKGLARVDDIYQDRDKRARELSDRGKKVIGYLCCYVPVELMTALDIVPYRISGNTREHITKADAFLETTTCSFVRSCFDLAIKGEYDFLDGLVIPHSCDTIERLYNIWKYYRRPSYSHFINIPHVLYPASVSFFREELDSFKASLEAYAGRVITRESLANAVNLHNENRTLLRQLYQLRKWSPPVVSGSEVLKVLVTGMSIPVAEHNQLLREVTEEVTSRVEQHVAQPRRVLLYGSEVDDVGFVRLIEECGAEVVMDDLCTGTRCFWENVATTDDALDGIARRYLEKIKCPRTLRNPSEEHRQDIENRFGHLIDYCNEYDVDAVVMYTIRFCDTYEFEKPDVMDFLRSKGIPVLDIEDEYSATALERLRTRIQAFFETLS